MGCKQVKESHYNPADHPDDIKSHIKRDILKIPKEFIENFKPKVNDVFTIEDGVKHSPFSYALLQGKYKSFRYIHEILGGSIPRMVDLLENQGICSTSVLIAHGNLDLFKYCFNNSRNLLNARERRHSDMADPAHSQGWRLPLIHQVALSRHITILEFLHKTASSMSNVPDHIDIHFIDSSTGENAALVACRTGDYKMIKYIFSLGGNFSIRNIKMQNAVQILAESDSKGKNEDTFESLWFLIFEAKIDIKYCYEECLLKFQDDRSIRLLENELQKYAIYVSKKDIVAIYNGDTRISKESKPLGSDSLSFMSYVSQASILGTVSQRDN